MSKGCVPIKHWSNFAHTVRGEIGNVCEVCGSDKPGRGGIKQPKGLDVAHLVSRGECVRLNVFELLKDRANIAVLCQPCHVEFDRFLGVIRDSGKPFKRLPKYARGFTALFDRRDTILLRLLEMATA